MSGAVTGRDPGRETGDAAVISRSSAVQGTHGSRQPRKCRSPPGPSPPAACRVGASTPRTRGQTAFSSRRCRGTMRAWRRVEHPAAAGRPGSGPATSWWRGGGRSSCWASWRAWPAVSRLAAIAGARRTDAALPRYQAATGAPDAIVFATQVGSHSADYTPVRRLPEVADAGEFALAPIGLRGYARIGALAPADRRLYRTVARPLLTAGRLPDPRRLDEIVVNRNAAATYGLGVGDRVTIVTRERPQRVLRAGADAGRTDDPRAGRRRRRQHDGPDLRRRRARVRPERRAAGAVRLEAEPGARRGRIAEATNLVVRLRPGADLGSVPPRRRVRPARRRRPGRRQPGPGRAGPDPRPRRGRQAHRARDRPGARRAAAVRGGGCAREPGPRGSGHRPRRLRDGRRRADRCAPWGWSDRSSCGRS